jgi:phosphoglycerate dehydrogenase-like enzyme
MSLDLSRRGFLAGLAAGGTALALDPRDAVAAHPAGQVVQAVHRRVEVPPSGETIKVMLAARLDAEEVDRIRRAGRNVEIVAPRTVAEAIAAAADAEVILGEPTVEAIKAAGKLKWVQHWAAGVERLPRELMEHPCVLTNMQRVFAPVIAETVFALLLGLTRGLVQASVPNFRLRKWERGSSVPLDDLFGKTIGVVGLGGIGSEVARRAHHGFGMRVLAVDPKPMPTPDFVSELREPAWLAEMVPQVDVLVSCAPHTRETEKMFAEPVFRALRRTAYFINVSRGGLVDQVALARALNEGWIRGAGLDVTTPEPLPAEDPLWDCPNLAITPHNSGAAPVRQVRLVALVAENVRRYSNGLALLNVVDKPRGY